MEIQKTKKFIKRDKPNKKWTDMEIMKILNYLQETPEVEAPTARVYYKNFIEKSNIDATWELIRWKVRHLKASYKKAKEWRHSTSAGLTDYDASTLSIDGKVLQMCPHFKQLNEIFGEKKGNGDFVVTDSVDVIKMEDSIEVSEPTLESSFVINTFEPICGTESVINISPPTNSLDIRGTEKSSLTQPSVNLKESPSKVAPKKDNDFTERLKNKALKSPAAHIAAFQAERTELFKIRLEWEKEKHAKELALSERKLKLEEEKLRREMDFKVLKLEKEEMLKILEIEKDERIRKFEIEMKYKCQSKQ